MFLQDAATLAFLKSLSSCQRSQREWQIYAAARLPFVSHLQAFPAGEELHD